MLATPQQMTPQRHLAAHSPERATAVADTIRLSYCMPELTTPATRAAASAASVLFLTFRILKTSVRCARTVGSRMARALAIRLFEQPRANKLST